MFLQIWGLNKMTFSLPKTIMNKFKGIANAILREYEEGWQIFSFESTDRKVSWGAKYFDALNQDSRKKSEPNKMSTSQTMTVVKILKD